MEFAYVTQATYKGLAKNFILADNTVSIDKVFSLIFEENLSSLLNKNEAWRLYIQKLMLEGQFEKIRCKQKSYSPHYIFSINTPKYHKFIDCDFLTSDFDNYYVPPQISAKGPEAVEAFQHYCEEHKSELREKTEEQFWANIGARFRIHNITPTPVNYSNSGVSVVNKESLEELRQKILDAIESADDMVKNSKLVSRMKYAPHQNRALNKLDSAQEKQLINSFFNIKWEIVNSIFDLYVRQSGIEDYILPTSLLASAGVEPCKSCFKN